MKSIAAKIRALSGLTSDGAELVQQAFGMPSGKSPLLAINELRTETDRGEQRGFANLLIGLLGTIRNPTAHNPKIEWDMSEQDALDILTTASLIHRKLDKARRMQELPLAFESCSRTSESHVSPAHSENTSARPNNKEFEYREMEKVVCAYESDKPCEKGSNLTHH